MEHAILPEDKEILSNDTEKKPTIKTNKVYDAPILKNINLNEKLISDKPVLDENQKPLF